MIVFNKNKFYFSNVQKLFKMVCQTTVIWMWANIEGKNMMFIIIITNNEEFWKIDMCHSVYHTTIKCI